MIRTMKKCPRCGFLITPGCGCGCGPGTIKTVEPLPAMPASVRELVDRIRAWPTVYKRDRELHDLAAAVGAHYAGGA